MNLRQALSLTAVLFVIGCQAKPPSVQLAIVADPKLNLNENNASLPVRVKVYQLAQAMEFKNAEYHGLWKNDKALLGANLLSLHEYTIGPNSSINLTIPFESKAKYIAVVALFRKPYADEWRCVYAMPAPVLWRGRKVKLFMQDNCLQLKY